MTAARRVKQGQLVRLLASCWTPMLLFCFDDAAALARPTTLCLRLLLVFWALQTVGAASHR